MLMIIIGLAGGWQMLELTNKVMTRLGHRVRPVPADEIRSPSPLGMRDSASPRSSGGRLVLLLGASMMLIAGPAVADYWYEHYSKAEQALEAREWTLAVQEINGALEKKGDSGARVRSYGMKVTSYFPYFKLGIAYYHLGQLDAALQAFETEARLGAIAQSESASAELERYRALVQEARATAAAEEEQRIRRIVEQSLSDARDLEGRGLLNEAMAALDQALAVAPDDVDALEAMSQLRPRFAEWEREQDRNQRASRLVEDGRALLREHQYTEASSAFRQALFLQPSPEVQELLETAQRNLLAELESGRDLADQQTAVGAGLEEVRTLESAGRLAEALGRLQSVLALEPSNRDAQSIQSRLLQARKEAEAESARRASIEQLLAEAASQFEAGSAEDSLSTANRVLALDPGNGAALNYVAQAYGTISRKLLGTVTRGNIPPAVRFVDLRREGDDGSLVQTITTPDFRLNGVIIDNSPVEVTFYGDDDTALGADLNSQPLGDFYLTEFNVESRLAPGLSTFRLVATDAEDLVSSSEYAVIYARPFFRAPWFYGLLLGGIAVVSGVPLWRRHQRREGLRRRRFNPYVAGAPVLEDDMFFGRRELVDRILQTIHNNSLLLYGERRIGKTSIQHQIRKRLRDLDDPIYEFHPVYIDLQGTPETRFFQTIAEDIFQELAPALDGLTPLTDISGDYSYRDFVRDVHAVLKALKKGTSKKVKLVLLIDEVDELNDYDPRINQKLRSLFMKSFAENMVAVVSGVEIKKQWEREGSPWYNFFEEIEVKPLMPQDARELIERPIGKVFKLDSGVVEKIISLTAGKPYLIQKICISLVTRLHEQHRRKITIDDVEALARDDLARI
jgi:tetratricopeptide (TPR) repeat protein